MLDLSTSYVGYFSLIEIVYIYLIVKVTVFFCHYCSEQFLHVIILYYIFFMALVVAAAWVVWAAWVVRE